jgi:hypothetical protein
VNRAAVPTPAVILATLGLSLLLGACAPTTGEPAATPGEATSDLVAFERLVAPFRAELQRLGVQVTGFQTFRYEGADPGAFIEAINAFYQTNPGFCPLQEAFYPAANGLQFMTLAGQNSLEVRGFLYDHARRPRLSYAYFWGVSREVLPATVCETVGAQAGRRRRVRSVGPPVFLKG